MAPKASPGYCAHCKVSVRDIARHNRSKTHELRVARQGFRRSLGNIETRSPRKLAWIKATHLPDQTRHQSSFHEWVRKHRRSLPNDGTRKVVTVRRYQRQMAGHAFMPRFVVTDIGDGDQVVAELDRHGRDKRIVRGYDSKRDRRKQFWDLRRIM